MSALSIPKVSFPYYNPAVKRSKMIRSSNSGVSSNKTVTVRNNQNINTYTSNKNAELVVKYVFIFSRGSDYMNISRLHNLEKLDSILALPNNWNENGAEKFNQKLVDRCKSLLDILPIQPEIFPTAANSIQFEYEKGNGDYLEFNVCEDNVYIYKVVSENEFSSEIDINQEKTLQQIVSDFYYG